nr:hypothetical protein [Tanacetum cinerariifolium]
MNMSQDRQIQNVGGNGRNQFGQYAGQVAQNQQWYNAWHNGGIQFAQNVVQNTGVQNGRNQNGLVVVPGIANQSGTGNIIATSTEGIQLQTEEFDFMAAAGDLDEIEEVNANCILMVNLQHASTSGRAVYGSTRAYSKPQLVTQNDNHVTSVAPRMVQSEGIVETSFAPNEETRTHPETVYRNLVDQVAQISYNKAYKDMQQKVERLQAQLRDLKGKSSDTPSASNTIDPLNQKLESKIVELEFQVVNYEREISHLKTTYKNLFDSIIYENAKLRARLFENTSESMKNTSRTIVTPHVDKPKLIAVTPHSKKSHASILSHSVPQPREFNVVKHRNVIAPGMFKIDPSQASRVDLENVSSDTVNASFTGGCDGVGEVVLSGGGGCGVGTKGRSVAARVIVDPVDRLIRNVFGFDRKARQKSFSTPANNGGGDRLRLVAAGNSRVCVCVFISKK